MASFSVAYMVFPPTINLIFIFPLPIASYVELSPILIGEVFSNSYNQSLLWKRCVDALESIYQASSLNMDKVVITKASLWSITLFPCSVFSVSTFLSILKDFSSFFLCAVSYPMTFLLAIVTNILKFVSSNRFRPYTLMTCVNKSYVKCIKTITIFSPREFFIE